jgi:hypothetical protein
MWLPLSSSLVTSNRRYRVSNCLGDCKLLVLDRNQLQLNVRTPTLGKRY